MDSNDPPGRTPEPAGDPDPPDDALRRLEQRLERASQATERLIAEAAAQAARPAAEPPPAAEPQPPPAGWQWRQTPESEATGEGATNGRRGEIDLLLHVLGSLRDRIPAELQRRLGEAVRELLLALRALIDWCLERSERRRSEPVEIQDIPIL